MVSEEGEERRGEIGLRAMVLCDAWYCAAVLGYGPMDVRYLVLCYARYERMRRSWYTVCSAGSQPSVPAAVPSSLASYWTASVAVQRGA
eukprot:420994-Rhodomonas_salina.1